MRIETGMWGDLEKKGGQEEMPSQGGGVEKVLIQPGTWKAKALQSPMLLPCLCLPHVF